MDADIVWNQYKDSHGFKKHECFRQLFETFHKPLCFFSNRILRNEMLSEDIVQEIFLKLWEMKSEDCYKIKAIKSFLYVTAQNSCLNYLRDQEIHDKHNQKLQMEELDEDGFLCRQIHAEVIAELFAAVEELPDKCKNIFVRSYFDSESEKEIAEALNISVNTVKTQKLRAKEYLRVRLKDLFVFLPLIFPEKFFS